MLAKVRGICISHPLVLGTQGIAITGIGRETWREIQVMRQVSPGPLSGWFWITLNMGTCRHLEGIKSVPGSQEMGSIEQWCLAHSRAFRRLAQQREQHIQEVKPRDTVFKNYERE